MSLREEILTVIEKNSRIGIDELAAALGAEEITVANEVKAMEDEGIICAFHTMIDWSKTSIEKVMALIEVKVTPTRGMGFDSIAERIYKFPQVSSLYLMSGAFDLMVIVEGKTLFEVAEFVNNRLAVLDTVQSTATHFILKKYKDHGTILTSKYEDTREKVTP
ncbi:Lrp/AsnC family transcriptional regulator [Butyrivibrio sp. MC2013]|uniref:Lrp/AsnC family transcriptional regulator n=1 Tax=Butyrivibrio sp. MC2013 TaxID=1280686 RepID=UPI00041BB2D8|nr:Lrp/AsnC family transcriptional regulator [Butyrivibrio sp. MC2013]